jgi:LysR family hca operon transcriptional activator
MSAIPSIRKLQYVLIVARELHFRKAAEKAFVAQPSLSRRVRECEEDVEFEIFHRDNHFVSLTKAGMSFVKDLEQILRRLEDDLKRAIERGRSISRRVASECTVAHSPFASLRMRHIALKLQETTFPHLDLRLRILPTTELLKAIESDLVHAGITFAPVRHPGLATIPIGSERWFAIVPARDRFSTVQRISISELKGLPLISNGADRTHPNLFDQLAAQCASNGVHFKFVAEVTSPNEAFDLVKGGIGCVLLPEGACEDLPKGVRAVHIHDITPLETVFVYRRSDTEFAAAFAEGLRIGLSQTAVMDEKYSKTAIPLPKRKPPVSVTKSELQRSLFPAKRNSVSE